MTPGQGTLRLEYMQSVPRQFIQLPAHSQSFANHTSYVRTIYRWSRHRLPGSLVMLVHRLPSLLLMCSHWRLTDLPSAKAFADLLLDTLDELDECSVEPLPGRSR